MGRLKRDASALTPRQEEVLQAIYDHLLEHGGYPSYRELMVVLGIKSPNGLVLLLLPLQRKGYVEGLTQGCGRGGVKTRTVRLVGLVMRPVFEETAAGERLREALRG